jgi:phospholipase C
MRALYFIRFTLSSCVAVGMLAGCGGASPLGTAGQAPRLDSGSGRLPSPIQHVVLIIQENRTFNDFFATFPGGDGTTTGKAEKVHETGCSVSKTTITLKESNLIVEPDLNHEYQAFSIALNGGKLNGFDKISFQNDKPECKFPYQYTNPEQIQPYWDMAEQYALAEHMFATQGSSSFVAHQDLIRGGTNINSTYAIVNDPTQYPWGCDAPKNTKTSLIDVNDKLYPMQGPFPCTKDFPSSGSSYTTLRDLLDAKYVTWKYYVPPMNEIFGKLMSAFDVIAPVRYGPEWKTNVVTPQTAIFKDISDGSLANMSWVIPDEPDSDHPGESVDDGPQWVASVVNAIGESSYWNSTAIIIVWDDWGGLYDNMVGSQKHGFGSTGLRVPAIIVSPYAKAGYISPTNYEFGSIVKYIENNWNLGRLGTSDSWSTSIIDCFNYDQSPIPFAPIASSLNKEYFIHRKPSFLPVDDDM